MSTYARCFCTGLVIVACALTLAACTPPGSAVSTAGGKPSVNIGHPAAGAQVTAGETVAVQVTAVDAQGVARVELWADNAPVGSQAPPQPVTSYQTTFGWVAASPGPHILSARAYNAAGVASDPAVVSVLVVPAGAATAVVPPPATTAPGTVAPPPPATVPPTGEPTQPPGAQPTPRPADTPAAPALAGKIAFPVLNADRQSYDTWIVNADGTNARRIVEKMRQPCLSPNGTMLAVNGEARDQNDIIVMNADGSNQRSASQHVEDSHPSWSAKGDRLVYDTTAAPGGGWQICIVDNLAQRSSWRQVPGVGGGIAGLHGRYPTWMPDGRIIFNSADYWASDTLGGLYVVGEGGGMPTRVTSSKEDTAPAVLGGTVAFMSKRSGGDYEIFTASVGGGLDAGLKQLTDNSAEDGLPAWSPDGRLIAFVSDEGGAWGLWVMNPDGSGRRKLVNLPGSLGWDWGGERVSWAP